MRTYRHLTKSVTFAILATSLALSACSSSDDDGSDAADDAGGTDTAGGADSAGGTDTAGGADSAGGTDTAGGTDGAGGTGGGGSGMETTIVSSLDDVTGETIQFGFISLEQPSPSLFEEGNLNGGFFVTDLPVPSADVASSFSQTLDTCTVTETDLTGGGGTDVDLDFEFDINSISAGDTIEVLSADGSTFTTLTRESAFGFEIYNTPEGTALPAPIPSGLTMDIPGDVFPAFSGVPIPDVTALTGVSPGSTATITPDTTFSWDAGGNPDVFVDISVFSFSSNFVSIDCIVADDGSFSFPASTRSELGSDFMATGALVSRVGFNFVSRGNALLVVTNISDSF